MLNGDNKTNAILINNDRITYGDLKTNINGFANYIKDINGKRISIFSENRLEWIYSFYAIWQTGNIPVPIDYMSGIDDVSFIINDCSPELIFCSKDRKEVLIKSLEDTNCKPRIVVFEELLDIDTPDHPNIEININNLDVAVIIYTSGTTGSPKGVMLTPENLRTNIVAVSEYVKIYNQDDRVLMLLPLHHIFPLLGSMITTLYVGATIAIAPSLNADDIIRALQKHKVTMIIGVPRLYNLFRKGIIDKINLSFIARLLFFVAKRIKSHGFSKIIFKAVHDKFGGALRFMIAGGAPLDPNVAKDFQALGFDILEGYGMTEAAPMITFTRPRRFFPGSAGEALPGCKIEVRDGEIVASGKNIMKGYYNRKKETNDILKDGWLYTGDLGYLDKKGRIYITGRKKDIIVLSNGKNINPVEIELKIEKLSPLIQEAGVFIMKDKLNLVIVPNKEAVKKEGISDHSTYFKREVLIPYNERATISKRLLKLHLSNDELPKTRLGKIQRFKLIDFVESIYNEEKKKHDLMASKELKLILDFLTEHIGQPVYPDDKLKEDLSINQYTEKALAVYLQNTFNIMLSDIDLSDIVTISDLGKFVVKNKRV